VTAVRPPVFPPSPAAQPTRLADRAAAQKAFFDLALAKSAAPQAAAAPLQAAAQTPGSREPANARLPDVGAEKPQKILRPGSLLDIRV
jgi:hypothetical protein